ncbi:transporter substrate-binding domain-containing protein [Pontibaca methylaminivorans]|uniref:Amino acid/amide ABC transporter substrate-binding protein, HAAT family n=1 Tax=Pontibaca methylaminivorans TaxID=515897 RepID=A0A1R3X1M0_9RHOB|nr:transporter substrate-binding domain-containing protein [Pontibaca methylaminivorans]SIT84844.1 amino acid/amide ABC transporter substrate-binding protein, HAAT family [Pontibaca methylaminivorans]
MPSDNDINIGVLFSTSGWTSVTERSMLSATRFAIEEINADGGINGRRLNAVYGDPKGETSAYEKMAQELLTEKSVRVILGCYTSSQRKAVLSVLDREAGLLCYPAQYEGFEYSGNAVYFGAVPNQNSFFLGSYLLEHYDPRVFIVGSDYVWPRESGRIMGELVRSNGGEIIGEHYLREDASLDEFYLLIKEINRRRPSVIFNNFVGSSNVNFYRAYAESGLDAQQLPVASLTTSEADIKEIGAAAIGHITAAAYFQSQDNPMNRLCLQRYQASEGKPVSVNMCWEAAYTQTHVVAQAMQNCDSDNFNQIRSAIFTSSFNSPQGRVTIDPSNSHRYIWPKIGAVREDGQFDIIAASSEAIRPDPYQANYTLNDDGLFDIHDQLSTVRPSKIRC